MELVVKSFIQPSLSDTYRISKIRQSLPSFLSSDQLTRLFFSSKNRWQFEHFVPGKTWEVLAHSELLDRRIFSAVFLPDSVKIWWVRSEGRFYEDERFSITIEKARDLNPLVPSISVVPPGAIMPSTAEVLTPPIPDFPNCDCMVTLHLSISRPEISERVVEIHEALAWAVAVPNARLMVGSCFVEERGISVSFQVRLSRDKPAPQISRDLTGQLQDPDSPLMRKCEILKTRCFAVACQRIGNPGPPVDVVMERNGVSWKRPIVDGCCSLSHFWVEGESSGYGWQLMARTRELRFSLENVKNIKRIRVVAENSEGKTSESVEIVV